MRLLRVSLEHFRGVRAAEVVFDPTGITVVTGANEAGKTTLLDAIGFAFSYPDNSKDRRLQSAKPVHEDEGPAVEIELTTGPYHLVLSKRWLKRPQTTLAVLAPRRESLTGRQAHDRLEAILDETLDRSLLAALYYQQGVAISQAALGNSSSLATALDAATTGGRLDDSEDSLFERVARERLRYVTEGGRPLQYRRDLDATCSALAAEAAQLELAIAAVEEEAEVHRLLARRLGDLDRLLGDAEAKRVETEAAFRVATELAATVEALETEHRLASAAAESAATKLSDRRRLVDEAARAAEGLAALEQGLEDQLPSVAEADARLERAVEELAKARSAVVAAERAADRAAAAARYCRTRSNYAMYTNRRETVGRAEADRQAARLFLDSCRLDEALMAELEAAHEACTTARARLDATRATIGLEALAPIEVSFGEITRQGLGPGGRIESPIGVGGGLVIEGVARIELIGAATDRPLEQRLREAEARLGELCVAAGVARDAGIDAARALDRQRREAAGREQAATNELRAALHDLESVEELDRRIAAAEEQMANYDALRDPSSMLDVDKASAEEQEARTENELRAARAAEADRELVLGEAERHRAVLAEAAAELRGKKTASRSRLEETVTALERARSAVADEALLETAESAIATRDRSRVALEEARALLVAADPDRARLDRENQLALLTRLDRERQDSQRELSRLSGSLERAGEEGLAESLDQTRERLARTTAEKERTDRLANAAIALFEVLRTRRDEARRAYVAPYREVLERLARLVFGSDVALEVDERSLQVTERTLLGRTVPFEQLSSGAKEQLAILGRLGCAMLVSRAAGDRGAPVIIDDALGYTDAERLQSIALAFAAAQESCQVIVLTCLPERYDRIGAAHVVALADRAGLAARLEAAELEETAAG